MSPTDRELQEYRAEAVRLAAMTPEAQAARRVRLAESRLAAAREREAALRLESERAWLHANLMADCLNAAAWSRTEEEREVLSARAALSLLTGEAVQA